ncbi:MAG: nicotinate-nucleotide--dimethylbenzimidazole phosphoribosyltransferase, partial [Clostridiales bacterium]|nr:nicotinate-nucleotide--dimethylbenzimidazole phosphoribosyltransferase [Clostridiales bacterium]
MEREQLIQLAITEPNRDLAAAIQQHWDQIAKPLDSMGQFEPLICRIGAILEDESVDIGKKAVIVMCADNGVIAEGVSQSESEVTENVAASMGRRTSSVCRMAAAIGADVFPVDIGMCCDQTPAGVMGKRVVNGTRNFAKEPAMTDQEVLAAIETGMNLVRDCKEQGYRILATGEMGIGNTPPSAAVAAARTGWEPDVLTGRGAG